MRCMLHSSGVDSQVGSAASSHRQKQGARQSQQIRSALLFPLHSTPLLPGCWRQPPETTRLCCKQHTCWLCSPSGPAPISGSAYRAGRQVCLQPGRTVTILQWCRICFMLARGNKKRSYRSVQPISKWEKTCRSCLRFIAAGKMLHQFVMKRHYCVYMLLTGQDFPTSLY